MEVHDPETKKGDFIAVKLQKLDMHAYVWYQGNTKETERNQVILLWYCNTWIALLTTFLKGN